MKASELIKVLRKRIKTHGDLNVQDMFYDLIDISAMAWDDRFLNGACIKPFEKPPPFFQIKTNLQHEKANHKET